KGEHGQRQLRRRLQAGHFEQRAAWAIELGLHEAARIGNRIGKITGRAAARAKAKAMQRDKSRLRIAGHGSPSKMFVEQCGVKSIFVATDYTAVGDEPRIKKAANFLIES